jgi:hypothetical protein
MGGQNTKPGRFVVRLRSDEDALARAVQDMGTVDRVAGHDDLVVVHITTPSAEASKVKAKAAWQRLRKLVGALGVVQPVLIDDQGLDQLPTGEISVRFATPPTDASLERFAASHDLRLLTRNEFVPRQAVFAPIHPEEQYLPEVIQSATSAKNVERAWANTLGQYRRLPRAR